MPFALDGTGPAYRSRSRYVKTHTAEATDPGRMSVATRSEVRDSPYGNVTARNRAVSLSLGPMFRNDP
jgi:hypothetical protein